MNLRIHSGCHFHSLLVILTLAAVAHGQLPPAANPAAEVTGKPLFSIPFYLNQNGPSPAEVQLYVSGDAGQTWTLYQRRQPQRRKFDFQAGRDGEYWFLVRTNEDQRHPNSSSRPEKIVIVDREEPELSIELQLGPSDELIARFRADDANLDPTSLRLEYRLREEDPWQPVPLDDSLSSRPLDDQHRQGKTSWVVATPFAACKFGHTLRTAPVTVGS